MEDYNKFQDAGRLEKDYGNIEASPKSSKPKMKTEYSRIKIDSKSFPYLHAKPVGEECEVKVLVRKIAEGMPERYESDKDNYITLEIVKIAEPKKSDAAYKELAEEGEKESKMNK